MQVLDQGRTKLVDELAGPGAVERHVAFFAGFEVGLEVVKGPVEGGVLLDVVAHDARFAGQALDGGEAHLLLAVVVELQHLTPGEGVVEEGGDVGFPDVGGLLVDAVEGADHDVVDYGHCGGQVVEHVGLGGMSQLASVRSLFQLLPPHVHDGHPGRWLDGLFQRWMFTFCPSGKAAVGVEQRAKGLEAHSEWEAMMETGAIREVSML